mgnify:CR=1 FL=1
MDDPQASEHVLFGTICRTVRAETGRKQKDVANAARIKQTRLSRIESGEYDPTFTEALRLMRVLGIPLERIERIAAMEHRFEDLG